MIDINDKKNAFLLSVLHIDYKTFTTDRKFIRP